MKNTEKIYNISDWEYPCTLVSGKKITLKPLTIQSIFSLNNYIRGRFLKNSIEAINASDISDEEKTLWRKEALLLKENVGYDTEEGMNILLSDKDNITYFYWMFVKHNYNAFDEFNYDISDNFEDNSLAISCIVNILMFCEDTERDSKSEEKAKFVETVYDMYVNALVLGFDSTTVLSMTPIQLSVAIDAYIKKQDEASSDNENTESFIIPTGKESNEYLKNGGKFKQDEKPSVKDEKAVIEDLLKSNVKRTEHVKSTEST